MPKINEVSNRFNWIYKIGFFVILALPVLTFPPYFFPADWGKSIIFRSIMAILIFLLTFQLLYKKESLKLPNVKKNYIFWSLIILLSVFLLATVFSVDPNFSLWGNPYRGGGFVTLAFYFSFAILTFFLFKNENWKRALDLSIIWGILVSLIAVAQYFSLFSNILLPMPRQAGFHNGKPGAAWNISFAFIFHCIIFSN